MTPPPPDIPQKVPGWPRRLALVYLWGVLLVWLFSRTVAERWWAAIPLLYFPQVVYLVPAGLPALIGLIRRDAAALRWTALGAAFVGIVMMDWCAPLPRFVPASAPRVRVLAYNIQAGVQGLDAIQAQVDRFAPDVVIFSEAIGGAKAAATRAFLRRQFPGWSSLYAREVFIASRWPFVEEESRPLGPDNVKYQGGQRRAGRAAIRAPFGRFQVLGAHFHTSMHGWTLKRERHRLPAYLSETGRARRREADQILAWIAQIEDPLIFAGDLNTPPAGNLYRDLTRTMSDSFREAGWGWGCTFPSDRPLLRIDYVLHSSHWTATRCEVGAASGSDHRPVLAELALTP